MTTTRPQTPATGGADRPFRIVNPDQVISPADNGVLSLTLRDRVLADWQMDGRETGDNTPIQWNPLTLEEVRDDARRRTEAVHVDDVERSLKLWHLDYRGHADLPAGRLAARYMTAHGWSDPIAMTRRALVQFGKDVLPSHGVGYNDALCRLGDKGRALATLNTAAFTQACDKPPRRVRLYKRRDVDGVERTTARAVVSGTYGVYNDVDLLDQLLNEPDFSQLPVLSYRATDSGMRVRCALEPMDGPPVVGRPIPMVEIWNSEVGACSVWLKAGMWTLHCTNGMAGWSEAMRRYWYHSGDMGRVSTGIPQALDEFRVLTSGAIERYNLALSVAIDDGIKWMEAELVGHLTADQLTAATGHLLDPRASMAPAGTLARAADAVTYSAHAQRDPFVAEKIEHAGAHLLSRGLVMAEDNRIKVLDIS
tara:strand:+ start:137 stop:1405 length:1269 start_codon:yes stop_codon:yes gene_type:complete